MPDDGHSESVVGDSLLQFVGIYRAVTVKFRREIEE